MKKTLLIDGDNLFKIGFHGVKEFYHKGEHIGGVFHFTNTIRKEIEQNNYDKVIIFWDGAENSCNRRKIYPKYKLNRRSDMTDEKYLSYQKQKTRVKQYLEEMFVRQIEVEQNESDDLIAYYCKISENENKVIYSSDRDYLQLISESVSVYSPSSKQKYKLGDKIKIYEHEIPHSNIKTYKVLSGDKSDNIDGIYLLGEKTLVKFFPEILENEVSVSDILEKAEQLLLNDKENKVLQNLLTGKTKEGIYGNEFFEINEKIVDLSNPLITEDGIETVKDIYFETLDPEGRNHKNLIKMMMNDGFFKFLPKTDDAWVNFIRPFLKLTRKEKSNYKSKKEKK